MNDPRLTLPTYQYEVQVTVEPQGTCTACRQLSAPIARLDARRRTAGSGWEVSHRLWLCPACARRVATALSVC